MKKSLLVIAPIVIMLALLSKVTAISANSSLFQSLISSSSYVVYLPVIESPPCADPLIGGELYATTSASIVHVGEIVTVTGTLYNNGCGELGQPFVYANVDASAILSPTRGTYIPCLNPLGYTQPGHYCVVQFTYMAADSGPVTTALGAQYEPFPGRIGSVQSGPIPIRVIPWRLV
jgi:hypothetical protein